MTKQEAKLITFLKLYGSKLKINKIKRTKKDITITYANINSKNIKKAVEENIDALSVSEKGSISLDSNNQKVKNKFLKQFESIKGIKND